MKLHVDLLCFYLLCFIGKILCDEKGPSAIKVSEGSDVTLPCSLSTKENIEQYLFDWRKDDGMTGVFMYDKGLHDNNNKSGQSEQFKGRVFHFQDELKHGNASIIIRNTKMADSGNYTCDFPLLQTPQIFHIELVVVSSPKPSVTILNATDDWTQLQCEVHGASPKPEVKWQDSAGNKLPAEEPQVTGRGGSYDIILQTTVTKTDHYRCVVTQEEISHQSHAEINVHITGNSRRSSSIDLWLPGVLVTAIVFVLLGAYLAICCLRRRHINRSVKKRPLQIFEHLMKSHVQRKAGHGTRTPTKPEDLQSRSGSEISEREEEQPLNTGAHSSQEAAPPDSTS